MTLFGVEVSVVLVWTLLAIAFAVLEGVTLGLTTIWFATGSLAGMVMAMLGFGLNVQLTAFILTVLLTFAFIRPLAKKVLKVGYAKTNVDSLIGKTGIVHVEIQPYKVGQVKVNGQIWTSKAEVDDTSIPAGEEIEVLRVDGVKLIVRPLVEREIELKEE